MATRSLQFAGDDGWTEGMDKVMQNSMLHGIYELVPHVPGMRTLRIGGVLHWKFKNGIFEKNKARLVTSGNHQELCID